MNLSPQYCRAVWSEATEMMHEGEPDHAASPRHQVLGKLLKRKQSLRAVWSEATEMMYSSLLQER
jgi:hypothetical protein